MHLPSTNPFRPAGRDGLLRRLTAAADRQHDAGMATIERDLEVAHFDLADTDAVASRRSFLRRAGTTAVTVGAATVTIGSMASAAWAQGGMGSEPMTTSGSDEPPTGADCDTASVPMSASDSQIVVFAESVERAAVAAYGLARENVNLGPAAMETARIFASHHTDHAEALRCLVAGTEQPANAALVAALAPQITAASSEDAIIAILRQIEAGAAATYLSALGSLETPKVAGAASTILPVEAQHDVVWSQYLGLPIVEFMPAFQPTDGAFSAA